MTKLFGIIEFFSKSLKMLIDKKASLLDLEQVCQAILELIVRTYSDQQMSAEVRDKSTELVDAMSHALQSAGNETGDLDDED